MRNPRGLKILFGRQWLTLGPPHAFDRGTRRLPASIWAQARFGKNLDPLLRTGLIKQLRDIGLFDLLFARQCTDQQLIENVERALNVGRLVIVQPPPSEDKVDPSSESHIAATIMEGKREVVFQSQRLSLVPAHQWERFRDEGPMQVVRLIEAKKILAAMSESAAPSKTDAFRRADAVLIERKAFGSDTGLFLVRHEPIRAFKSIPDIPRMTPSQMKALVPPPKRVTVNLERRYHDDEGLQGCDFELKTTDGTVIHGKLSAVGKATVSDLPEGIMHVRFGPDTRRYAPKHPEKNLNFVETFTAASADALVSRYQNRTP